MLKSAQNRHLPDADRLSVLAAIILLAYVLARFVDLPTRDLVIQLPGLFLSIPVNMRTAVAFLAAGLMASGADWLLRDHPAARNGTFTGRTTQHLILPALTAWVVGIPLFQLSMGLLWWAVFAVGGGLLILVLIAEYIILDPSDARHAIAVAGLTAVSFTLYLILAIVLRSSGLRLLGTVPALMLAAGLVSLRTLHLRFQGQWKFFEAIMIALIVGQIAAALHYWPLSPVSYGLAVLGPAYALTSLVAGLAEGDSLRQAALEPGLVLLVAWLGALWIR
jgi:hypothetical protein